MHISLSVRNTSWLQLQVQTDFTWKNDKPVTSYKIMLFKFNANASTQLFIGLKHNTTQIILELIIWHNTNHSYLFISVFIAP